MLNLQHLAELVTTCTDDYLRFDSDYREAIVLDRASAVRGTHQVLQAHSIPAAMSADLQQALQITAWPPPLEDVQDKNGAGSSGSVQQVAATGPAAATAVVAAAAAADAVVSEGSGSEALSSRRRQQSSGGSS